MKIEVNPRSLERFEQHSDASITVWKPEDVEFQFLIDAKDSLYATLYDGDVYEVERIWEDSEPLVFDAINGIVYRINHENIVDYADGKKVTLYPPMLEAHELYTVDRWVENLEDELEEWLR